jgi:hypothetical protein
MMQICSPDVAYHYYTTSKKTRFRTGNAGRSRIRIVSKVSS